MSNKYMIIAEVYLTGYFVRVIDKKLPMDNRVLHEFTTNNPMLIGANAITWINNHRFFNTPDFVDYFQSG